MFDYDKFIETYATTADYKNFVARFSCPDEKGVWTPTTAGPITIEGVIDLLLRDSLGDLVISQIHHW